MRYRDRDGKRRLESTGTEDWHEANRVLRDRLQARDNNSLDIVGKASSSPSTTGPTPVSNPECKFVARSREWV